MAQMFNCQSESVTATTQTQLSCRSELTLESHKGLDHLVIDDLRGGILVNRSSGEHVCVLAVSTVHAIGVVEVLAPQDNLLGWVMLEDASEASRALTSSKVLAVTVALLEERKVVRVVAILASQTFSA